LDDWHAAYGILQRPLFTITVYASGQRDDTFENLNVEFLGMAGGRLQKLVLDIVLKIGVLLHRRSPVIAWALASSVKQAWSVRCHAVR